MARNSTSAVDKQRRSRKTPLFPSSSFEEALTIPNAIQKFAAGQKVRRLTLFDQMGKSADSGPSRQMVTNSGKYGLTTGSYTAEYLELTSDGQLATGVDVPPSERLKARFRLGIEQIAPFKAIYDALVGNRLPANSVLEDLAKKHGVPPTDAKECVEKFIVNSKFVGILKPIAGAERIIPIGQALEDISEEPDTPPQVASLSNSSITHKTPAARSDNNLGSDWSSICLYISPIGDDNSEHRQHADLFLGSIVKPALEEFQLKVVRADRIGKPGMITSQIIEHILKSKLVIADLSYHNPNVFYELCLRHVCRLPTVQIIRKIDKIPFDLDQFRTISIDASSIFR